MKTTKRLTPKKNNKRVKSGKRKPAKTLRTPRKPKPDMKWQVDEYERHADMKFSLPYQFLLICKLLDTPPRRMILDFMDNVSMGSHKREGREKARELLLEYILEMTYGQEKYSPTDIRTIFKEADAVGLLFPSSCKMKFLELHDKWRSKYYHYWFRKWKR